MDGKRATANGLLLIMFMTTCTNCGRLFYFHELDPRGICQECNDKFEEYNGCSEFQQYTAPRHVDILSKAMSPDENLHFDALNDEEFEF